MAPSSASVKIGLFEVIWSLLLAECGHLGLVDWQWQATDGSMGKARNGGDQVGEFGAESLPYPRSAPIPPIALNKGQKKACSSTGKAGR
jgi:hypothetical protein